MSKSFFDFFPPPRFLQMPSVGFSVSDTHLRFVSLEKHGESFVLGTHIERELPAQVVSAGYVHQPEQIIAILVELKKAHKLQFVKATIPEEKAFVFRTQIPEVAPEEMRSSIEFTIEENVPMKLEDVEFDFTVVPNKNSEQGHIDVAVSVVPKKVVETYLELFTKAGLTVLSFELESQAIARAVVEKNDTDSYLVLNLERAKTGFYITTGDAVQFTSTMTITPDDMTSLCEEITKIYWHAHGEKKEKNGLTISKILLCGEGATKEGVREGISNTVGIEVEIANVWKNVFVFDKYVPDITLKESFGFAAAIGLVLPSRKEL